MGVTFAVPQAQVRPNSSTCRPHSTVDRSDAGAVGLLAQESLKTRIVSSISLSRVVRPLTKFRLKSGRAFGAGDHCRHFTVSIDQRLSVDRLEAVA